MTQGLYLPDGRVNYRCTHCGVGGVKLWRHYNSCLSELFCVDCACASECSWADTKPHQVRKDGCHWEHHYWSVEINGLVPCITDEEGTRVWGYASTHDRWGWWRRLPLRPWRAVRATRRRLRAKANLDAKARFRERRRLQRLVKETKADFLAIMRHINRCISRCFGIPPSYLRDWTP